MLAKILSVFWTEKLRFTQYTIEELAKLSEFEFQAPKTPSYGTILQKMVDCDRDFRFFLPISMKLSGFLFLPRLAEWDINKDIEIIRDRFTPPAFPPHFFEIRIQSASELRSENLPKYLSGLVFQWKGELMNIESRLERISEEEAYRKRYFSLTGIHTISGAINRSTEYCHQLWSKAQ